MKPEDVLKFYQDIGVEFDVAEKKSPSAEELHLKEEASVTYTPSQENSVEDHSLEQVTTLEDLRQYMENFERCDLKHHATQLVFSDGVSTSDIMFVGEAPGAEEDKLGRPFVGQSGQMLDKFLAFLGLSREKNIYIANIVPWRPPANRTPTADETAICLPMLLKHIEIVKPKVIVFLGGTSFKGVMRTKEGILRARGRWHELCLESGDIIKCMPIFHPAYLLRSPKQKALFWQDLIKIKKEAYND